MLEDVSGMFLTLNDKSYTELKLKQVDMGGIPHFENKNGQAISARPDEVQFMAPTNL